MKFIIVDKATLKIMGSYEADVKDDSSANRSWLAAEPMAKHLELPEGLSEELCEAVRDEQGEIVLQYSKERETEQIIRAWGVVRNQRDALLSETDKYMLPDFPISSEKREEIMAYRELLRKLPEVCGDPRLEIEWPEKPSL